MFSRLSELQSKLMQVLDVPHVEGLPFYLQPSFREAMIGAAQEALETHEAAGAMTKPWKSATEADVKEELIDVLFYWLEAVIVSGMTQREIEAIYLEKYYKNLRRVIGSEHADPDKKAKANAACKEFVDNHDFIAGQGWQSIHSVIVVDTNE